MKQNKLTTRRSPVRKTLQARLFNKPLSQRKKRQRASAAASSPEEIEDRGINIPRSLAIIFAIHILAIGLIFIHKQYLAERTPNPNPRSPSAVATAGAAQQNDELPKLSSGERTVILRKGDNYSIIAARYNVEESDLRNINLGTDIRSGAVLRIPPERRIVAEQPPEVLAYKQEMDRNNSDDGLIAINRGSLPQSSAERPAEPAPPRAEVVSSGRTHTIKKGDNIWRISKANSVSQKALMDLNNIKDPTKLKIGQVLKLP